MSTCVAALGLLRRRGTVQAQLLIARLSGAKGVAVQCSTLLAAAATVAAVLYTMRLLQRRRAPAGALPRSWCGCELLRKLVQLKAAVGGGHPQRGLAPVRRVLLIVNPASGSSTRQRTQRTAELALALEYATRAKLEVHRVETEHEGHATTLVRDADLARVDAVCIAGGDGSLREAVTGDP